MTENGRAVQQGLSLATALRRLSASFVPRMEVRRLMVAVKHPDDNSEESAQLGHGLLALAVLCSVAIAQCGQYLLPRVIKPRGLITLNTRPGHPDYIDETDGSFT